MTGRANGLALALGLSLCLGLAGLGCAKSASEFGGSTEMGETERSLGGGGGGSISVSDEQSAGSTNDLSADKRAPQQLQHQHQQGHEQHHQDQQGPQALSGKYPSPQTNNKGDLSPMFNLSEYAQLIFSPFELVKKISDAFKLPQEKLVERIGKGLIFGAESLLTPLIASLKIIEKVFVPDHCRLKLLCQIGSKFNFVKETILRFSPNLLHGSAHLKAITDGMTGQNCGQVFKDCEPKLKRSYEDLKSSGPQQQQL